ncbi:ABC transporter F family member 4 [Sesamum indicum]|uniref:ABC transporter F family member 4 n=1 Tax=Sesamum indicum TaxID=4182 RepID=A0A6I9TE57_SESIN|nr:ABC transporter F family member 4 [Sesamum indicum]XP_011082066.1 ABC transporter F family member 4 [Sesamum indicum]XP_020550531.1 ABC transporter F family member 4 [Sesamum indicum]
MAARARDTAPGKEKRGTSPSHISNTATTQRRRSPNPSKTNSPARTHNSTSPSDKHIPNYLRPTVSSSPDVSKSHGKKPVSTAEAANKPNLARRRSFDKPPSPSRTMTSRISPNPRVSRVSPNPTLRSSSFSGKSVTPVKGVADKSLRTAKDAGKQPSLYARAVNTVKKSSTGGIKKQDGRTAAPITKDKVISPPQEVENPHTPDVPEPEMQYRYQEMPLAEAEEQTVETASNYEKGAKDSLLEDQEDGAKDSPLEDQEPVDFKQTEYESSDEDAKIVTVESSTIPEKQDAEVVIVESYAIPGEEDANVVKVEFSEVPENQDAPLGVMMEEPDDDSDIKEISSPQQELKEQGTNEINNINSDESVAGAPNEDVEEEERKEEEEEEAMLSNENEEVAIGSEAHEPKETELKEIVVEVNREAENATPKSQKNSPVSNDVIEETANKLREQRKNKVKALAGAFETVISLQEK